MPNTDPSQIGLLHFYSSFCNIELASITQLRKCRSNLSKVSLQKQCVRVVFKNRHDKKSNHQRRNKAFYILRTKDNEISIFLEKMGVKRS